MAKVIITIEDIDEEKINIYFNSNPEVSKDPTPDDFEKFTNAQKVAWSILQDFFDSNIVV